MSKFSLNLIQRIQKYFADRYGDILTPAEAEEYLDSFADFYLAIAGVGSDSLGGVREAPDETSNPQDLIYPHNCKNDD